MQDLKLAAQWSFFVSEKWKTTFAVGYINELLLVDLNKLSAQQILQGNVYNPFFIAAKRFGNNFHTLLYTGPVLEQHFKDTELHTHWQMNSNLHYMISGTRNFIGLEFNKEFYENDFKMTIRPQMRVGITDNLLIGIVGGIPVSRQNERLSSFVRLIYEPPHKN